MYNCNRNSHLLYCNRKMHHHTNNKKVPPQNLHRCNRRRHLNNCRRKCQLHSSNRNFHLQKWCQPGICLVTIKKLSKSVTTKFKANSLSTPWETRQWIESMKELCCILIISIFNILIFIHFTNQITLKPSLA